MREGNTTRRETMTREEAMEMEREELAWRIDEKEGNDELPICWEEFTHEELVERLVG